MLVLPRIAYDPCPHAVEGSEIYVWLRHIELQKLPFVSSFIVGRDEDKARPHQSLTALAGDDEFTDVVAADTSKPGHNEEGLTFDDLLENSSHVTIAKVWPSKEDYQAHVKPMGMGVAVCSKKDQFNRAIGRETAMRRALGKALLRLVVIHKNGITPVYYYQPQ